MAERKTLLKVEYISDHSCGNYFLGEIDTMSTEAVKKHIQTYGENGFKAVRDFAVGMIVAAGQEIMQQRWNAGGACQGSDQESSK